MKSQRVRLFDVLLLGPALIWIGSARRLSDAQRAILFAAGAGTIFYNWRNYSELQRRLQEGQNELTEKADCCVACHLLWEEQHVFGFLPPEYKAWIQGEHEFMRQYRRKHGDWPRAYLVGHAAAEDPIFEHYLPEPMLRRMKYEHEVLEWKAKNGLSLDD